MSKKKTLKGKKQPSNSVKPQKSKKQSQDNLWPWFALVIGITAVCLWPMLNNEFTNWDDEFYVTNNLLLRGPDLAGIFSEQVVGNYHPLTVLSLAFNYAISGLDPFSYLLVNYILHILNTLLVFRFIWLISGKNKLVALFVALVFGIHPMHVESVAWVSERKDVLYTFFFLLSLIQYWKYLASQKKRDLWVCFFYFLLSLLSKPAAIILPGALLLLDYWNGRQLKFSLITSKIHFFILSLIFGITTVMIQSPTAMAGLNVFTMTDRLFFACYVLMTYFIRFIVPYPLSAFHPFPASGNLGWPILLSPLFVIAVACLLWFFRKQKLIVFGILFYIVNLLLVLQILSIGLTIVSERYTYVPYIGLAFIAGMFLFNKNKIPTNIALGIAGVYLLIMGVMTFQRTKVWQNSFTLWTDVINKYPDAPHPRTNRANYLSKIALTEKDPKVRDSLYKMSIEDCNLALKIKPNLASGYEKRGLIYMDLGKLDEALSDGDSLVKYAPQNKIGYDIRGAVYFKRNQPEKSLENYLKCVELKPDDHRSYSNIGIIYMNFYQQYDKAIEVFNKAIAINPLGNYYLNRSICYYRIGNTSQAREDAVIALQKGSVVPEDYKASLNIK